MAFKKRLSAIHVLLITLATVLLCIGLSTSTPHAKTFSKKKGEKRTAQKNFDAAPVDTGSQTQVKPYKLTWSVLGNIGFKTKDDGFYADMLYPVLTQNLREMKGKTVELSGYIIPVDDETYVLSKNVMASCFFCGTAGAETISGLNFKKEVHRLATDTYVTVQGIFSCNETDPDDWIYTIEEAVIINNEK